MKVADEVAWQGLLRDFANDTNPQAPILRDFTVAWAEAAEKLHEEDLNESASMATQQMMDSHSGEMVRIPSPMTPIDLLRATLAQAQAQFTEYITVGVLGAALVVLSMHWDYGESLYDGMTKIEQRLVEDTALLKIMQLNKKAQESGNG